MKKLCLNILFILSCFNLTGQTLLWDNTFDEVTGGEDIDLLDKTLDGNIIVCGTNGSDYCYIIKLDSFGNTIWYKHSPSVGCYGSDGIKQLRNGQYMHFGELKQGSCSNEQFLFERINNDGTILPYKAYGGNEDILQNFIEIPGGSLGVGSTGSEYKMALMKLDSLDNKLWYKSFKSVSVPSVLVNQKGNYVLYGTTYFGNGKTYPYFLEVTPDGDSIQSKFVIVNSSYSASLLDYNAAIATSDGNYLFSVLLDTTDNFGNFIRGDAGLYLVDSAFNIKWEYLIKATGNNGYSPANTTEVSDGYITVISNPLPNSTQYFIVKVSKTGLLLSKKTMYAPSCTGAGLFIENFVLLEDGSIAVSGGCFASGPNLESYVARIKDVGTPPIIDTCQTFGASFKVEQNTVDDSLWFVNTSTGGYAYASKSNWKFADSASSSLFTAKKLAPANTDSVWARLIATNPYGCSDTIAMKVKVTQITIVPPPPVTSQVFISNLVTPNGDTKNDYLTTSLSGQCNIEIYNTWGKMIYKKENYSNEWSGSEVSDGIYFYTIFDQATNKSYKGWVQVVR